MVTYARKTLESSETGHFRFSFRLSRFVVLVVTWVFLGFYSVASANPVVSSNVKVIIESNLPKNFEGIDVEKTLLEAYSSELEPNVLRLVHLVRLEKETYSYRRNVFEYDPKGNYIQFRGEYYYTSSRTRYRYDSKEKKYVPDKDGWYVYVPEYRWARKDEDRYIMSSFYTRREEVVNETLYGVALYVTDIDLNTFYVKRAIPVVTQSRELSKALRATGALRTGASGKFSEYKYDIVLLFESGMDLLTRMLITSAIQREIRFNVYDRTYLSEVFERIRLGDLLGEPNKGLSIKFRPAKYVLNFTNFVTTFSESEFNDYVFIPNPFNGSYIKKSVNGGYVPVRVEVGNFYSYDRETKSYKLDREKGIYVRYFGGPWEDETYTVDSSFYEYFLLKTKAMRRSSSLLMSIIDAETGEIVGCKRLEATKSSLAKNVVDIYGSETVTGKFEIDYGVASSVSSDALRFSTRVLKLSTFVESVEGGKVTFASGENTGIRSGMVFRLVQDGFTSGFARVERSGWERSEGTTYYVIPGETLRPYATAFEEVSPSYPSNVRTVLLLSPHFQSYAIEGMAIDINGYPRWSFGAGLAVFLGRYLAYEDYVIPNELSFSYFFTDNLTLNGKVFAVPGATGFEVYFSAGLALSTFARSSVFNNTGWGFTVQACGVFGFGASLPIVPLVTLGFEVR